MDLSAAAQSFTFEKGIANGHITAFCGCHFLLPLKRCYYIGRIYAADDTAGKYKEDLALFQ